MGNSKFGKKSATLKYDSLNDENRMSKATIRDLDEDTLAQDQKPKVTFSVRIPYG